MTRALLAVALLCAAACSRSTPSGGGDGEGVGRAAQALLEPCARPGRRYCETPLAVIDCNDDGEVAERTDCSESDRICGWDFEARGYGCVAATEQCDRPNEHVCLTRVDVAFCTELGLVEPGDACIVRGQICGWDDARERMACIDPPASCGFADQPCCGAAEVCGLALTCVEGNCRPSSPGCGSLDEPCCNGITCQATLVCNAEHMCTAIGG